MTNKPCIVQLGSTDITGHIEIKNRPNLLSWLDELAAQAGMADSEALIFHYDNRKPSLKQLAGQCILVSNHDTSNTLIYIIVGQKTTQIILVMDAALRAKVMNWALEHSIMATLREPKKKVKRTAS